MSATIDTSSTTKPRNRTDSSEARIRVLVDEWTEAHRVKDAARVRSVCADGNVQFIMAPPLQFSGANGWNERHLEPWFSSFEGPLGYEVRDLTIAAGDDTAFCHFLTRFSATAVHAGEFSMWYRVTLGCRNIGGEWKISHVHESVPFYMDGNFKAATDLEPQNRHG